MRETTLIQFFIMDKLFNLIDSVLKYVDNGSFFRQPFKWLYYILGVANIVIPIKLISTTSDYSDYLSGKAMTCMILLIIISIPFAFFGAMIWIKRGNSFNNDVAHGSRFVAIPLVANIIQTCGEWMGYLIGVGGFIIVLFALLFGGSELSYVLPGYINVVGLISMPIAGFLTVLVARFFAESCLAIASIANHTRSIDKKIKD